MRLSLSHRAQIGDSISPITAGSLYDLHDAGRETLLDGRTGQLYKHCATWQAGRRIVYVPLVRYRKANGPDPRFSNLLVVPVAVGLQQIRIFCFSRCRRTGGCGILSASWGCQSRQRLLSNNTCFRNSKFSCNNFAISFCALYETPNQSTYKPIPIVIHP